MAKYYISARGEDDMCPVNGETLDEAKSAALEQARLIAIAVEREATFAMIYSKKKAFEQWQRY